MSNANYYALIMPWDKLDTSWFREQIQEFRDSTESSFPTFTELKWSQFLLLISIIKLILLKIRLKTGKFQIYEWQRATVSGADETRH
jgi:hypothetical protein